MHYGSLACRIMCLYKIDKILTRIYCYFKSSFEDFQEFVGLQLMLLTHVKHCSIRSLDWNHSSNKKWWNANWYVASLWCPAIYNTINSWKKVIMTTDISSKGKCHKIGEFLELEKALIKWFNQVMRVTRKRVALKLKISALQVFQPKFVSGKNWQLTEKYEASLLFKCHPYPWAIKEGNVIPARVAKRR